MRPSFSLSTSRMQEETLDGFPISSLRLGLNWAITQLRVRKIDDSIGFQRFFFIIFKPPVECGWKNLILFSINLCAFNCLDQLKPPFCKSFSSREHRNIDRGTKRSRNVYVARKVPQVIDDDDSTPTPTHTHHDNCRFSEPFSLVFFSSASFLQSFASEISEQSKAFFFFYISFSRARSVGEVILWPLKSAVESLAIDNREFHS